MLLSHPPVPAKVFTRHGDQLVTDAAHIRESHYGRIYDDACDLGIFIRGNKYTIAFAHTRTERDPEDNTPLWYEFTVISEHRKLAGGITKVVVFND